MADDFTAILNTVAEDRQLVTYRPRIVTLTDSVLASVLLSQVLYWWVKGGRKPFYKFRQHCKHKDYKPGDSWCEELEWNTTEFDNALRVIGTKIVKGISKKEMLEADMPTRAEGESDEDYCKRLETAVSRVVIYWTDSNRVTHYQVNENLLGKLLSAIYLDKSLGVRYLKKRIASVTQKNRRSQDTFSTETTSETNAETTKEISAPIVADTPPTPEPTIVEANTPALPIGEGKILAFPSAIETTEDTPPRAEFHAVTAAALGITGAAYPIIEKWVNFLTGNTPEYTTPRGKKKQTYNGKFYELQVTPGMSIDEIGAFGRWYRATHPGKTPYTTCEGLNVDTAKFRAAKDHDRYVDRFHHDRTDVIIVDDSALPKAAGAEGDAIPISADKRAEAERIMAELLAKMNGNGVKRDTNRQ